MSGLEVVVIAGAAFGLVGWIGRRIRSEASLAFEWQSAAETLGLEHSHLSDRMLSGSRRNIRITVTLNEGKSVYTDFHVSAMGSEWPASWTLRGPNGWGLTLGSTQHARVLLHDESFDEKVHLRCEESLIVALLDVAARRAFRSFVIEGGSLGWGKLSLRHAGAVRDRNELTRLAVLTLDVAECLDFSRRAAIPSLLLDNVKTDPNAGVRLRNLEVLSSHFHGSPELIEAADAALKDVDESVRIFAASVLRTPAAMAVLHDLVGQPRLDIALRLAALEKLTELFDYSSVQPTIARALGSHNLRLCRAAVVAAGKARDASAFERLRELGLRWPSSTAELSADEIALGESVAEALGRLRGPGPESVLIGMLEHVAAQVRVAACNSLGEIGTIRAVEPLLPLTHGLLHGDVKDAAREAIRSIQARLGDAEAGRVSIAAVDASAGAVSLASAGGEVSLLPDGKEPDRDR